MKSTDHIRIDSLNLPTSESHINERIEGEHLTGLCRSIAAKYRSSKRPSDCFHNTIFDGRHEAGRIPVVKVTLAGVTIAEVAAVGRVALAGAAKLLEQAPKAVAGAAH